MYSEIFTQFILGQRLKAFGWMQPTTDNNYVGGYLMEYENGYKTVTKGGGCQGDDYTTMYVLDPNNTVLEKYEQDVF